MQVEVCRAALHFIGEMKRVKRRLDLFDFRRSVQPFSSQVKFKLSIAAIRNAHGLLIPITERRASARHSK